MPTVPVAWSTAAAAAAVGTLAAARLSEHGARLTATLAVGLPIALGCFLGAAYSVLKRRYLRRVRILLGPDTLTKVPLFGDPISYERNGLRGIVARSLTYPTGGAIPYTVVIDQLGRPCFAFGTWWWSFDALQQLSQQSGLPLDGNWSATENVDAFATRYPGAVPWAIRQAHTVGSVGGLVATAAIVAVVLLVAR